MPFPPSFDHVWDITTPPDTQLLNQGALDFRSLKDDVMQRMSLLSGTTANRPTPEIVNATWGGAGFGLIFLATDTGIFWQWNGAAWVNITSSLISPSTGVSLIVASVSLAAQSNNIASTLLYAVPALNGGWYRASTYLVVTTVAATSSALPQCNLLFTDFDTSASNVLGLTQAPVGFNTIGTFNINVVEGMVYVKAGTNINFVTTGYASNPANSMQYSIHMKLEYLGL